MSEAKPTPGPWEVCGKYIEPPNRADRWICELPSKPDAEAEANARLIAAAPDLLEAANRVLHEIFMNSGAPDIEARTTEALGRLAEAIAKAEGRDA